MTRRILHIINSLTHGGAEAMLCELARRHDAARWRPVVATLIEDHTLARPLVDAGIEIHTMGMRPGIPDPRGVARLSRLIREIRPHVIQTWMDHSNLIGGVAARLAGATPVVWGLHQSVHTPGVAKRSTLMTVAACAKLSRHLPATVVSCSHHGAACYIASGFEPSRMRVIPNGFDSLRFRPDPTAPAWLRAELGLDADVPLVLLPARFDPFKDHETFVAAAARIAAQMPDVRFVLCGAEIDANNAALASMLRTHGVARHCHLLGPRRDIALIFAAVDLVVSSSISEAFPLVLGEAMSCGTICVATDVGDSAHIVGEFGRIVPPSDPAALGDACVAMLSLSRDARAAMGAAARQDISERFDLTSVTRQYERLYDTVLQGAPRQRPVSHRRPVIRTRQQLAAGGDAHVHYAEA